MTEDRRINLTIQPCPCGHEACRYHVIPAIMSWHQGTGFDRETAAEICVALATMFPDKYVTRVVTTILPPEDRADCPMCGFNFVT